MPGSPGVYPKNDGDTVYAADYNNISETVREVIGFGGGTYGYGQGTSSGSVGINNSVTASQWNSLRSDMFRAYEHQTGSVSSGLLPVAVSSALITNELVNQYRNLASSISGNRFSVAESQTTLEDLFTPRQRTDPWNGKLIHDITIDFVFYDYARFFFNTGGYFIISASRTGGTTTGTAPTKNTVWTNMLSSMGEIRFRAFNTDYTGTGASPGYPTNIGWWNLSTTNQLIFVKPAESSSYSENQYRIYARKDVNLGAKIIFTIEFDDLDSGDPPILPLPKGAIEGGVDENVDGTLTSRVQVRRSTGVFYTLLPAQIGGSVVESGL